MSERKKYIPPFIHLVEVRSSQLLSLSVYEGNKIRQDLTNSQVQVLGGDVCNGNLSKDFDGDEGPLW